MSQTNARLQGGGIVLPQGSSPGNVNVGEKALFIDTDGTAKTIDSTGTKASLAGGTGDAWYDAQVIALSALVPGLTRFEYIKGNIKPNGAIDSTILVDPGVVGGAVGVASDTTHLKLTGGIYPTPRTDKMAVAYRVKFPAIAAAKTALCGLSIVGGGGLLNFGWDQVTNATKWQLFPVGGAQVASTTSADTLWHDLLITSDGTTMIATIDGVEMARSTAVATLTNSLSAISIFASATLTPGVMFSRGVYGCVDPT